MPEVLWLLEHVRLWVDPLKDAAGSPFGKADRLYTLSRYLNRPARASEDFHGG